MSLNRTFLSKKWVDWNRDISALANPILLILIPFIFLGTSEVFYRLLFVLFLNELLCSLIKIFYHKQRPSGQTFSTYIEKIDAGSFPSIHSSRITIAYLTLFTHSEHIAIKLVLLLLMVLVMISRVILKKHYWVDVLGGFLIGLFLWGLFFIKFSEFFKI